MSSPVVDRVRAVPLIVEQGPHRQHQYQYHIPMEVDDISGFPFERETDRDAHFRSQLDDIAKRHPEFAEHLGNFRTGTGVRRQSSLGGADEPDFPSQRRFQRPAFGSRFEKFGFPFDGDDDFDPEKYAQQFYQPHQEESHKQQPAGFSQPQPSGYSQQQPSGFSQQQQQPPPSYSPQQSSSYSPQQQQTQPEYSQPEQPQPANQPEPERSGNNIQQSNTVDLGQKQEPVNDRSQRSMSAPPPEKGQRFTSSINIPVNQQEQTEDMAQTQHQANAKTTERIIPIHVEDRDEPVMPKKAGHNYSQQHSYAGNTQPETIFGRRPEEFTHFMNREPRQYEKWNSGFNHPEEFVRQQRFPQQQTTPPQQQQQPQPKGEIPIPVKVEVPLNKQQANQRTASPQPAPQQQAPPQPPPQPKPAPQQQKKPSTPLEQIQAIQGDVAALAAEVDKFQGKSRDKYYLYLDEMLTRNLLKLDNIDTQGKDDIRTARKEAIRSIEKTISVLESRAAGNVQPKEKMEVEDKSEKEGEQAMEVTTADASNKSENSQQMEVVAENAPNAEEAQTENKSGSEGPKVENAPQDGVPVENRAVLVENKPEQVENRAVLVEKPAGEETKMEETCEGQESNLAVADAVKKFEGASVENKEGEEIKPEESSQEGGEAKAEDKKAKKKGKKKVEKK